MSSPSRPPTPPAWRWLMRVTGLFALLLFLTPTVYVLKYYAADRPQEERRAARVSLVPIAPAVPLDAVAPPLAPTAPGNAADFYTQAIQAAADRAARTGGGGMPTAAEAALLFEGARRADCRFFGTDPSDAPHFVFRDPDSGGAPLPYRFPLSPRERYRYLGAAGMLARAVADAARTSPIRDPHRVPVGQALVRFGEGLGRERATRTHLEISYAVQKMGLGLLLPFGGEPLRRYVDSLQQYEERVQAKYALLEPDTPENIALQERVAEHDGDSMWRREAVWALGATLAAPGMGWRRPLETLTGKATLAQVATRDGDQSVRAAASETLGEIAQRGAVIRR